jgi:hypothetical protein
MAPIITRLSLGTHAEFIFFCAASLALTARKDTRLPCNSSVQIGAGDAEVGPGREAGATRWSRAGLANDAHQQISPLTR